MDPVGSVWLVVVFIVVVVGPAVVMGVLRNEGRRARDRVAASQVRVDAFGVRRELSDGRVEEVSWGEVEVVEVVRAAVGPHGGSGGVVLVGGPGDRGALVPLDRVAESGLLGYLERLEGFDRARFDAAVERRAPARITVWPTAP
jgi:hypothetical protein